MLASLACTITLGGPPMPPDGAAPSPEALASFNRKWLSVPETLGDGQFILTFTEDEVASAVNAAIVDSATGVDIPLKNIRVDLNDDMVLYAQTNGTLVNASGMMIIRPSVDRDGQLTIEVQASEFGRVSFDDPLPEQVAATFAYALTSPTASLPIPVVLSNVSVADDQLVIAGTTSK